MSSKFEDIFNRFLNFEEKHLLFEKDIRGFTFWSHIRFSIFKLILENSGLSSVNANSNLPTIKKISKKNLLLSILKSPLFIFKKSDFLVINSVRRNLEEGKYKCIYTDFLVDAFDGKTQSIEMRNPNNYQTPAYSKNIKYTDLLELISGFYLRILRKTLKLTEKEECELKAIATSIAVEFKLDLDFLAKRFIDAFLLYRSRKPFYNLILNRVDPKTLFIVSSYNHSNHLLVYLAQKKGIEVVELQHGSISAMNVAYNIKHTKKIYGLPDKMLLFGEFWKENIHLPIDDKNFIVSGFKQLDNDLRKHIEKNKIYSEKKTILILSQWTISDIVIDFALQLSSLLSDDEFCIKIRLHPMEYINWKQKFPQLNDSNIQVNDNFTDSLYDNFSMTNYIIGGNSTALYEAVAFNKKIFVLSINDIAEYVADLYQKNYAVKIDSAQDFVNKLESNIAFENKGIEKMWFPSDKFIINNFFQYGSSQSEINI